MSPLPELVVLGELAQTAADGNSDVGLDEVGHLMAARFVEAVSGRKARKPTASLRDRRRAVESALWIDANSHRPIDLEDAASAVDAKDKILAYQNMVGLMKGDLTADVAKGSGTVKRKAIAVKQFKDHL